MTLRSTRSLTAFLDAVAAPEPAPGGGAATAVTAAMAAALVAMAARYSRAELVDADEIAARAGVLRHRALELGDEDSAAYAAVLDAYRSPRQPDPGGRKHRIRDALQRACDIPLAIAAAAAEVAELAASVGQKGNPRLRGDAATGAHLAAAAATSAAELVFINVQLGELGEELTERAAGLATAAAAANARWNRPGAMRHAITPDPVSDR